MKKLFLTNTIGLCSLLFICGCNSDSDEPIEPEPVQMPDISGKWVHEDIVSDTLYLNPDGTYKQISSVGSKFSGTYSQYYFYLNLEHGIMIDVYKYSLTDKSTLHLYSGKEFAHEAIYKKK